ncbi:MULTISPECIES: hypothetical protein [Bacillus]|uniref:hypothetical protein n=1 Tax=Bacillus TaxID=1386 RepID=UPI001C9A4207|nr:MULTISPECIES: hypothetical protein [Bacillus]MBY7111585.1 hypothetical protein [Bacillus sp. 17RED48]MCU5597381.1 hypothetical protein [Bacillus wiedmannii]
MKILVTPELLEETANKFKSAQEQSQQQQQQQQQQLEISILVIKQSLDIKV